MLTQTQMGSGKTVLVVEDDNGARGTAADMLRRFGYDVIVACDGPEAEAICESDRCIDLLFTDIVMPSGTNGIDLANKLHRVRPGLKVLLTVGSSDERFSMWNIIATRLPLLRKPYRMSGLSERLRTVLDG